MQRLTPISLAAAMTADAVSQALRIPPGALITNDITALIQGAETRLLEITGQANTLTATAEDEGREFSEDERTQMDSLLDESDRLQADLARHRQVMAMNERMATMNGRRSSADGVPGGQGGQQPSNDGGPQRQQSNAAAGGESRAQLDARRQQRNSLPATPRQAEHGMFGFNGPAAFYNAVLRAAIPGAQPDQRLIVNAPTVYGNEGTGADGGFLVPPDIRTQIMQKVQGEASMLPLTDQQVTSSNQLDFPVDETSPWQSSGGIQAYWEVEAGQKTQSKPSFSGKSIKLNKLTCLVPVSDELLEDAPQMASYINSRAPTKMMFRVNDAIMNGQGIGMPLGILNSAGTVVVSKESAQAADTVLFANLTKLWSAVTPEHRRNAKWYMSADVEGQLMGLSFPGTGTAVPVYLPPGGLSAAPYGTLFGRPIMYSEAMPALGDKGDIVFGDLSNYITGVKVGGIRSDVSMHVYFDYDVTAFRFVLRLGGQPWWNAPITAYQAGASARGFFSTLEARA